MKNGPGSLRGRSYSVHNPFIKASGETAARVGEGRVDLAAIAQEVLAGLGCRVRAGGSTLQQLLEFAHIGLGRTGEIGLALDALADFVIGTLTGQRIDAAGENIRFTSLIARPGLTQCTLINGAGDLFAQPGKTLRCWLCAGLLGRGVAQYIAQPTTILSLSLLRPLGCRGR